jgi:hypothetical protein
MLSLLSQEQWALKRKPSITSVGERSQSEGTAHPAQGRRKKRANLWGSRLAHCPYPRHSFVMVLRFESSQALHPLNHSTSSGRSHAFAQAISASRVAGITGHTRPHTTLLLQFLKLLLLLLHSGLSSNVTSSERMYTFHLLSHPLTYSIVHTHSDIYA